MFYGVLFLPPPQRGVCAEIWLQLARGLGRGTRIVLDVRLPALAVVKAHRLQGATLSA